MGPESEFKPTELEQVMETNASSKDLGRLKNDDEFTRKIAEEEKADHEEIIMDAKDPRAADLIKRTGGLKVTSPYSSPQEADRRTDVRISAKLSKNKAVADFEESGKIDELAGSGTIYDEYGNEKYAEIQQIKKTRKAIEGLEKEQS